MVGRKVKVIMDPKNVKASPKKTGVITAVNESAITCTVKYDEGGEGEHDCFFVNYIEEDEEPVVEEIG